MVIDRRQLFAGLIAALAGARNAQASALPHRLYLSCRMDAEGNASVACIDGEGLEVFSAGLPARGHDVTVRPEPRELAVFARRPGNWFAVIGSAAGDVRHVVHAIKGRHFFGHGAYAADGRLLYASENDIVSGEGRIGIYDATNSYRRIGEFASGGIGPHDLALLPDGRTLVVANGGLRTHPESGREVLNLSDMKPNLALIDLGSGEIIERHELSSGLRQLSIRHLSVRQDHTIAFGCQHQGSGEDAPPLLGLLRPGGTPQMLEIGDDALFRLDNYIGSVSFDDGGDYLIGTSPQGGSAVIWDMAQARLVRSVMLTDVCGAAPGGRGTFVVTSGNAGISKINSFDTSRVSHEQRWIWDNHARSLLTS